MRNKVRIYQDGKSMQHEDGMDEQQKQIRDFLARSRVDLGRPRRQTIWCPVKQDYVERA